MAFGHLLTFLESKMSCQYPYGWFHITTTLACILIGFLLCRLPGAETQQRARTVIGITTALVILSEIVKQIINTFEFDGAVITADYQWYAFPFQFCSTPMYIGLIAALTKGRVHRACCDYLGSYALFAGIAVLLYPAEIYNTFVAINIQTMICHGSMLTLGIYLLRTGYVKYSFQAWWRAAMVFLINVAIAAVMNEIAFYVGILETDVFNMFYISPHCEPTLAVYSLVQAIVPYPFCLVIYILVFSLAAWLVLFWFSKLLRLAKSVDRRGKL